MVTTIWYMCDFLRQIPKDVELLWTQQCIWHSESHSQKKGVGLFYLRLRLFWLRLRSRPPFTGVLLGPGPESAPRSAFWAILGTCLGVPQRVLFECFLAFFGPENAKKDSKSTLWGTSRQVPKTAQKALRGALSGPGPKSTPVNGGRDRKVTVGLCYLRLFCLGLFCLRLSFFFVTVWSYLLTVPLA